MSSQYIYLHSIARVIKTFTISSKVIDELLAVTSFREMLAILRREGVISDENVSPNELETSIKKRTVDLIRKLLKFSLSSKDSYAIMEAYYYESIVKEFESVVNSVLSGESVDKKHLVSEDPSLLSITDSQPKSFDELIALTRGTYLEKPTTFALEHSNRSVGEIDALLEYYSVYAVSKLINGMKGDWKVPASNVTCTKRDYFSLLLQSRVRNAIEVIEPCKLSKEAIRDASTGSNNDIVEVLRRSVYARELDLSSYATAISDFERLYKISTRRSAYDVFLGMNFSPALLIAISEILLMDMRDLIAISNAINLNVSKDKVKKMISIDLI
ncbi:hypothetical protein HS7_06620 [Sulfolobales archaeon HS-7]|nr:hypothetical protein HS7_06620 [Sulfolobales archaeon HS-7]